MGNLVSESGSETATVRLLARNGEYVRVDDETGQLVARRSPGREWDTWTLQPEEAGIAVHLAGPAGYFLAAPTNEGHLHATQPAARSSGRFTLVPLADPDGGTHHHKATGHGEHGFSSFGPTVALRSADGHYVGLEPGSDGLVCRAEELTWDSVFVVEYVAETARELVAGSWTVSPKLLGVTGVHTIVLPTGNVLFFSYANSSRENNLDSGVSELWNPDTGPVPGSRREISRNLFCAGHCWLGNGRLLVAGGQSNNYPVPGSPAPWVWGADHDVHTYNPQTNSWTRHADMPAGRYYPTCTTLANGDAFIASGAAVRGLTGNIPNDDYEVFRQHTNALGPKLRFRPHDTGYLHHAEYPFVHLLHDGSPQGLLWVFSWKEARLFDIARGVFRDKSFPSGAGQPQTYKHQGASVLLPIRVDAPHEAKILVLGGGSQEGNDDAPATSSAEIFEYNGANPDASQWRRPAGGNMRHRRFMSDAVLLPDETVLVVNGAGRGAADKSYDAVFPAEIFDTRTETWSTAARINRPRLYHSTAALLPDGRVLIAGNTYTYNPGNEIEDRTAEVYSPPYLSRGARPEITSAPTIVAYGQEFRVGTPSPDTITSVALMRPCSVTHTNDMSQRHLILPIVRREAGALIVGAPPNGTIAPPGPYMLFLLNSERVPSRGRFLQVQAPVRSARFVRQSVPDEVQAGDRFSVAVTMQNTGTLRWTVGGNYRLGSQSPQDNQTWGQGRVGLHADVEPGATATFTFTATAPSSIGTYVFQWRMLQELVEWFGQSTPAVRIVVAGGAEPPECAQIRAELVAINEEVAALEGMLTGNPRMDLPILRQISRHKARAQELTHQAQSLGCVIPLAGHH